MDDREIALNYRIVRQVTKAQPASRLRFQVHLIHSDIPVVQLVVFRLLRRLLRASLARRQSSPPLHSLAVPCHYLSPALVSVVPLALYLVEKNPLLAIATRSSRKLRIRDEQR